MSNGRIAPLLGPAEIMSFPALYKSGML